MLTDDAQVQITNMGNLSQTNAETQEQPPSCLVNMKAAPPMQVPTPTVHVPVHLCSG